MADYKGYLAANILTEDKLVTYRLLSRALKVNVNTAKEMLYEFHRLQNGKKPGTIHATYLLSGLRRREETVKSNGVSKTDGEDEYMQSSPFMSSSMPQQEQSSAGETSVLTITLVREEDLEDLRSQYEHISSIHIYSLGPHPLKDLQLLADATRQIKELTTAEDPIQTYSNYGTITNPNVNRRTNRRPPPVPTSVPAVTSSKPQAPKPIPQTSKAEAKVLQPSTAKDFFASSSKGNKEKPKSQANTSNPSSKEGTPAPNPPTLKRESSSIFKAFAKTKPPKEAPPEDSPMRDVSDDEEETYAPPKQEIIDVDRKGRKEREAALKQMMEDDADDEAAEDKVVSEVATPDVDEDEEMDEPLKEEKTVEPKEEVVVSDGRRRGKRRVMKKKTVKDEEGYLVTKEEAVWESFSEDEPAPQPKPKVQVSTTAGKPKKLASKPGQGNIMSFFGKK